MVREAKKILRVNARQQNLKEVSTDRVTFRVAPILKSANAN